MVKEITRVACLNKDGGAIIVTIDENDSFKVNGYKFQIHFEDVIKDGIMVCEEARVTCPAFGYPRCRAYR